MGKLQDHHYITEPETPQERLQAEFCPPLDSSLVEAIWNDTFDYQSSHEILTTLAEEAEHTLDEQDQFFDAASSSGCEESTTATTLSATNFEANSEEENIEFLLTCFPTLALTDLKDALQEQKNDVEKATDLLLSMDAIKDDVFFDISKLKKEEEEGEAFFTKMEKKSKKQKKKSVLPIPETNNLAVAMDRIALFFPTISRETIENVVNQCNGRILPSVKRIMEKEPSAQPEDHFRDWDTMKALIQVKEALETVMIDQTSDSVYRVAVATLIQEEQKSVEYLIQVAIDFFLSGQDANDTCWTVVQPQLKRLKQSPPPPKPPQEHSKQKELPVIPDYLLLGNQEDYIEEDPVQCREKAMEITLERNELYRKAAAAYRRSKNKGPGESGVAYFYSDSARKLDEQVKEWNMRAAKAIVRQQRIKHNDDHLLDFHGLTVAEARVMLVEGITQWWSRSEMQSSRYSVKPLKIITGVGNHSQGQQSKLLPMTLKYLKSQGWLYEMPNPGCIIVKNLNK